MNIGTANCIEAYIGTAKVKKLYLGSALVKDFTSSSSSGSGSGYSLARNSVDELVTIVNET